MLETAILSSVRYKRMLMDLEHDLDRRSIFSEIEYLCKWNKYVLVISIMEFTEVSNLMFEYDCKELKAFSPSTLFLAIHHRFSRKIKNYTIQPGGPPNLPIRLLLKFYKISRNKRTAAAKIPWGWEACLIAWSKFQFLSVGMFVTAYRARYDVLLECSKRSTASQSATFQDRFWISARALSHHYLRIWRRRMSSLGNLKRNLIWDILSRSHWKTAFYFLPKFFPRELLSFLWKYFHGTRCQKILGLVQVVDGLIGCTN